MLYKEAVAKILWNGIEEKNDRTKSLTRRLFGQTIEFSDGNIFTPRSCNPGISAAELAWMLSGERDTTFMKKYCKIWNKFEDAPDYIHTAYGFRWRHLFNRDQIEEAMLLLEKDPSSRQALVMAWDPCEDGLTNQGKYKNIPCPFSFSLYISKGKLKIVVYQRSADLIAGVPYDLMTYWMLGKAFANTLKVGFSGVSILFGDLHIYESHYDVAGKICNAKFVSTKKHPFFTVPNLREICEEPDNFVMDNWDIWKGLFAFKENVTVVQ